MKVAEVVVSILEDEGIQAAFGIPGAAINPVYGFLKNSKIEHYVARHEEGAVHAADGYFRASGKLALAICTSGPGATNFVTGLYTAQADSIPLIAITGNANATSVRQRALPVRRYRRDLQDRRQEDLVRHQPGRCAEDHARGLPHRSAADVPARCSSTCRSTCRWSISITIPPKTARFPGPGRFPSRRPSARPWT